MPCGCGSKSTVRSSGGTAFSASSPHVFKDDTGVEHEFPTEVQALAAQVRANGSGTVYPR